MKFSHCLIVLGLTATVLSDDSGEETPFFSSISYFTNVLNSIQGALEDIFIGGENLKIMESKLEGMVDASSYFFRAESVSEYAMSSKPYTNAWKHDNKEVA